MEIQIENEQLTESDIYEILDRAGIPCNSGSEFDYVKAKCIVFGNSGIDTARYSEILYWIIEYVNC